MKERSKGEKATEIHTHPSTHPQNLKKKKIFYPTQLLLCYYGNSTGLGSHLCFRIRLVCTGLASLRVSSSMTAANTHSISETVLFAYHTCPKSEFWFLVPTIRKSVVWRYSYNKERQWYDLFFLIFCSVWTYQWLHDGVKVFR